MIASAVIAVSANAIPRLVISSSIPKKEGQYENFNTEIKIL